MVQVLVVVHLLIAIVMIALILLQKNEGAAGAGFSAASSVASMNQVRSRPNPLSRATTILGICFFATSLGLALLAKPADPSAASMFAPAIEGPSVPKIDDGAPPSAPADAPVSGEPKAESSTPAVPTVPNN